MDKIPFNPYIVGNPIKTREMFFGREDDFQFVMRKLGSGASNQVLVFCGERRSGKTSILFQILGGRLGERFLPVLVDMQILAGIRSDEHFFRTVLKVACAGLSLPRLSLEELERSHSSTRVEDLFEGFLSSVEALAPGKILLFLLDEYELIEEKIRDGSLSESTVQYLAGALESPHRISFIFTGSTNLEKRKVSYWKTLLGKSMYRKISYLSPNDTARLITEPLAGYIRYPGELVQSIYRLTGGQPFYTQVICQNMVDHLMEEGRGDPTPGDLAGIVKGIIDNPLPQMIYSWNSLTEGHKLLLASLAGLLGGEDSWADAQAVLHYHRQNRLSFPYGREQLRILLEEAYHQEFLEKREEGLYRFRMDLMRRWIGREHSIWKVAKEAGASVKRRVNPLLAYALGAALLAAAAGFTVWYVALRRPAVTAQGEPASQSQEAAGPVAATTDAAKAPAAKELTDARNITLSANAAPFRAVIDGSLNLTSQGQADESVILLPSLARGLHRISFHHPVTGETIELRADIRKDGQLIRAEFTILPAPAPGEQPAAAEGADTGALFLSSVPASASVFLDASDTGLKTPGLFERIPAGEHRISLVLEGYRPAEVELSIAAGVTLKREVLLSESYGEVLLDVRPTAQVLLDGAPLVETPYVKPVRVRSGRHVLTLVNEKLGVRKQLEVEVQEGQTLKIVEVLQ